MSTDADRIAELEERLHAARLDLQVAYDQRDTLAVEIDALCHAGGLSARPSLLNALHVAERALIDAESAIREVTSALRKAMTIASIMRSGMDP